ncbi:MAG: AraC family transcriptional regulator [Bacteroidaceae bacterium]|nr:AraC family transcriptional regulator [Bacteroidaceae bacterium]MBO4593543.1 AraC family transcriptional regulator [Bacteroidaceae bacterium]
MKEMNSNNNHPLVEAANKVEQEGMVIIDDVRDLPTYGEPYIFKNMLVAICHQGTLKAEYDSHSAEMHPHEISVVPPRHMIKSLETSRNFKATLMVVSELILEQMKNYASYRNHIVYNQKPRFLLTDEQYETMCHFFSVCRSVCKMQSKNKTTMILHSMEALYMLLDEYRAVNKVDDTSLASPLFVKFYDALAENYREQRSVAFYANVLCLSPKYFGTVIRQETGMSASGWIESYVVMKAKLLLSHNRMLSIREVSRQMGFPDQAAFARYFRCNAGISPSEYRKQLK